MWSKRNYNVKFNCGADEIWLLWNLYIIFFRQQPKRLASGKRREGEGRKLKLIFEAYETGDGQFFEISREKRQFDFRRQFWDCFGLVFCDYWKKIGIFSSISGIHSLHTFFLVLFAFCESILRTENQSREEKKERRKTNSFCRRTTNHFLNESVKIR